MAHYRRSLIIGVVVSVGALLGVAGAYGVKAAVSQRQISDYLRSHSVRKLQLGAGDSVGFQDWLNTDIEQKAGVAYLDATKPFPIPDGALSYVFAEQLIEHLTYDDGLAMLGECHRTLKPGGTIRIATPNLLKLIQMFQNPKSDEVRAYMNNKFGAGYWSKPLPRTISPECVLLNSELANGHRFVYDPQTLRESLQRAGFQAIQEFAPGASDDPQLTGLERRHKAVHHETDDYETMVFQAVRQ